MQRYTFFGVVYPERALIELREPLSFDLRHDELDFSASIRLAIYKSQIVIEVETPTQISNIYTARNLIKDAAQTVLDIAGMEMAVAYNIDIRAVSGPDHHMEVFGPSIPALGIKNDETGALEILGVFTLSGRDPYLRRALADIRSAISYPADTGFFCYRAIESLVNSTLDAAGKSDKKQGITQLESELRLDVSCLEMLRQLGGGPRHGKIVTITSAQRSAAIGISREIIKRYIAHKQGERPDWELLKA